MIINMSFFICRYNYVIVPLSGSWLPQVPDKGVGQGSLCVGPSPEEGFEGPYPGGGRVGEFFWAFSLRFYSVSEGSAELFGALAARK